MPPTELNLIHVVARDTPPTRWDTLRAIRAHSGIRRQHVVQVGSGDLTGRGVVLDSRIATPLGVGWLAARTARRVIPRAGGTIIHVWSRAALEWAAPGLGVGRRATPDARDVRIAMAVELPADFTRLVRGYSPLWARRALHFICPTGTARQRLVEAGVAADACVVVRDAVDYARLGAARAVDLRRTLRLSGADTAVLILPPVSRASGSVTAAWAAMLLGVARADVRLVAPGNGRESRRVAELVASCGMSGKLRVAPPELGLVELLAGADLTAFLPEGDAPLNGVLAALAAGKPIVASAVPAVTELLVHGRNAWLCRPGSPRDAARRMLQVLDDPQRAAAQASAARTQVFRAVSRQRMLERYRRVYENLLADRLPGFGLDDDVMFA